MLDSREDERQSARVVSMQLVENEHTLACVGENGLVTLESKETTEKLVRRQDSHGSGHQLAEGSVSDGRSTGVCPGVVLVVEQPSVERRCRGRVL